MPDRGGGGVRGVLVGVSVGVLVATLVGVLVGVSVRVLVGTVVGVGGSAVESFAILRGVLAGLLWNPL